MLDRLPAIRPDLPDLLAPPNLPTQPNPAGAAGAADGAEGDAPAEGVFVSYPDSPFQLFQPYPPAGDQPQAIDLL